jgi:dihydroorotase
MPGNMFEAYHQGKIRRKLSKKCVITRLRFSKQKSVAYREGYYADLVIVNSALPWSVKKEIFAKCGWTFEGFTFKSRITHTFVNGQLFYNNSKLKKFVRGRNVILIVKKTNWMRKEMSFLSTFDFIFCQRKK